MELYSHHNIQMPHFYMYLQKCIRNALRWFGNFPRGGCPYIPLALTYCMHITVPHLLIPHPQRIIIFYLHSHWNLVATALYDDKNQHAGHNMHSARECLWALSLVNVILFISMLVTAPNLFCIVPQGNCSWETYDQFAEQNTVLVCCKKQLVRTCMFDTSICFVVSSAWEKWIWWHIDEQ